MINFNFTLADSEAELMMSVIHNYLCDIEQSSKDTRLPRDTRDWYHAHSVYANAIKKKIIDGQTRLEQ